MLSPHKRFQVYSFLFLLLIGIVLVFLLLRPFFNVLAAGFILAVLFSPIYKRLLKLWRSPTLSAIVTILTMLLVAFVPLWFIGQMVFGEAVGVYQSLRIGGGLSGSEVLAMFPVQVQEFILNATKDFNQLLGNVTSNAFSAVSQLLSNLAGFVLSFFLVLFTAFYLLKDGHHIKQVLMDLSPIANEQESLLATRISGAVNGVVKGTFLMALIQGLLAGIGFWIFGVPNPALWGTVTVLAALVPTVGTALSMVPAILFLILTGHLGSAVGLTIWGGLAVGMIDNFLGPKIVGRVTSVHPLLVLFSILGGVSLFGFLGFLLGPILMAVFVALVQMYRHDFQKYLGE